MNLFSKKELSPNEEKIANVIESLCENEHSVVSMNPDNAAGALFLIVNDKLHFKILIDNSGVVISNTDWSRREHFSSKALSTFKLIAKAKFDSDWSSTIDRIILAEDSILDRMIQALSGSNHNSGATTIG